MPSDTKQSYHQIGSVLTQNCLFLTCTFKQLLDSKEQFNFTDTNKKGYTKQEIYNHQFECWRLTKRYIDNFVNKLKLHLPDSILGFLCVIECHKSYYPHIHFLMILNKQVQQHPFHKNPKLRRYVIQEINNTIKQQWELIGLGQYAGFCKPEGLMKNPKDAIFYVLKYLEKNTSKSSYIPDIDFNTLNDQEQNLALESTLTMIKAPDTNKTVSTVDGVVIPDHDKPTPKTLFIPKQIPFGLSPEDVLSRGLPPYPSSQNKKDYICFRLCTASKGFKELFVPNTEPKPKRPRKKRVNLQHLPKKINAVFLSYDNTPPKLPKPRAKRTHLVTLPKHEPPKRPSIFGCSPILYDKNYADLQQLVKSLPKHDHTF